MKVEVQLDSAYEEPKVVIFTSKMTDDITLLIEKLSEDSPQILSGFNNGELKILEQTDIIRLYTANGKVFAVTESGEYVLRLRLYELEERLDKGLFVRISNSEIINLKKTKSFDLSLAGTICVKMTDGSVTYASRRYVARIKKVLGI